MLKCRRLRGDMIEVFKIVHNYYDSEAAVKLSISRLSPKPCWSMIGWWGRTW